MNGAELIGLVFFYGGGSMMASYILDFMMPSEEWMGPWERFVRRVLVALPIIIASVTIASISILLATK